MNLRKATLLAIIGICYIFALRTTETFFLDLFKIRIVAQAAQIMSLLASLSIVLFLVLFCRGYVQKEQVELRKASLLAIIGSSAMLLVSIKGLLLLVFKNFISLDMLWSLEESHYIGAIVPWVSSIFILVFFIVFYRETLSKEKTKLRIATLLAITGSSISTLLLTFVLFNYVYSREIIYFVDLSKKIAMIFLPVFTFSFFTVLYFFSSFYQEQKRIS